MGLLAGSAHAAYSGVRRRFYNPHLRNGKSRLTLEESLATRLPARRAGTPTNITAIDLGTASVRVVEVEWTGTSDSARVVRRGSAPLPSNVWNDLSGHREIVSNALRSALASAGSTAKSVVACLP